MIILRTMRAEEFAAYLDYFIKDYAEEIAANYGVSREEAKDQAVREIEADLPQGPETEGEALLCIEETANDENGLRGYLWYRGEEEGGSIFINDFYVLPDHQSQGLGKAALRALEERVSSEGYTQIKLRVAVSNRRAQRLYEASGYGVTGVNMSKNL